MVRHAQLLARRAVDVPRHAAVGELDADGVVVQVVVYPRYPAPGIAHEGARGVVGEGVLLPGYAVEVRGARVGIAGGFVAHADEHVAHIRHVQVVHLHEAAVQVVRETATPQPGDVAVAVIVHDLAEVVRVAREVVA